MNSRFFFLPFILLFTACGVKKDPILPPGTELPRIQTKYMNLQQVDQKKQEEADALKKKQ